MGTWGHGYFQDDSALDFMVDLEESDNPKELIVASFEAAIDAEYMQSDEGTAAIVSAVYVDRQANGTIFSSEERGEYLEVDTFPDRHPQVDLSDVKGKAAQALKKVLDENSEINELWAEDEEFYPAWRAGVEQLILRLSK